MLNIKQLNHSIDSLSESSKKRLVFYKDKFFKQYPYLQRINDTVKKTILNKADSVEKDSSQLFNIAYPLLENFKRTSQVKIVDHALNQARNNRDNAIFYKNEFENRRQVIAKHEVVWHQKLKLSLACLIFFFIGAPLGAIIRKGGLGLPVVVSVVFFVLYHVVTITGEKASLTGEWNVIFGSWLSTALILPLGLFLTYKATTDAPLLDAESWKRFFERFKFLKLKKK
jgi:lipopolysaccharide export system permease protein